MERAYKRSRDHQSDLCMVSQRLIDHRRYLLAMAVTIPSLLQCVNRGISKRYPVNTNDMS